MRALPEHERAHAIEAAWARFCFTESCCGKRSFLRQDDAKERDGWNLLC